MKKNENITLSVGNTFPTFIANDIYGKEVDIKKYKGKVMLIAIQSVSQHMKRDKEEMERSQENNHQCYKKYKKQGLKVIVITHKNGIFSLVPDFFMERKSKEAHKKHNTRELVTILLDSDGLLKEALGVTNSALVFLIDRNGVIRYIKNGHLIMDAEFEELVNIALKELPERRGLKT